MSYLKLYSNFSILLFVLHLLISLSSAESFTFNSAGCANPSGFDSCWATTGTAVTNCWADYCEGESGGTCTDFFGCESTSSRCTTACICVMYAEYINCALNNCWNQVYGCDYQELVILALQNCPQAKLPIPYFPAPQNAPGGCSCDISQVFDVGRSASIEETNCQNNISSAVGSNQITPAQASNGQRDCTCCGYSFPVSTFFNLCPDTDPSQLTFFNNLIPVGQISQCAASLDSIDCTNTLGFTSPGWTDNAPWVNPNDLPANGTQSLSNLPGSLTAPVSGSSLVWSLGAVTETAIASPNNNAGNSGAKTTSAVAGGKSGTSTGTAPAATGSKNSSAEMSKVGYGLRYVVAITVMGIVCLSL